jgi:hypothetical protein
MDRLIDIGLVGGVSGYKFCEIGDFKWDIHQCTRTRVVGVAYELKGGCNHVMWFIFPSECKEFPIGENLIQIKTH